VCLSPRPRLGSDDNADHTCFRPGQPALISGSGYTPGGEVALTFNVIGAHDDTTSSTLLVSSDSAGAIALRVKTPRLPLLESPATVLLSATDQEQAAGGPPPLVSTRWRIATFNASYSRGEMFKRARQFPFRRVPAGVWSIKVDTSRSYPNNSRGHLPSRQGQQGERASMTAAGPHQTIDRVLLGPAAPAEVLRSAGGASPARSGSAVAGRYRGRLPANEGRARSAHGASPS
jgi:hypothetical protein